MSDKVIYTQFRASDAEQRSYSLRERLNAGKYLFEPDPVEYRKMDTWQQIFWNAVHVVFDNRIFKNTFLKQTKEPDERADRKADIDKSKAGANNWLSSLMTAGYWNIYAWLEVLTLFWVNYATSRYNPLIDDSFGASFIKELHISVAALFYAAARTINLIATPLTIILLASAFFSFGLTPVVSIFLIAAIVSAIFSVVYHHNQSQAAFEANDDQFHWMMGLRHLAASLVMGIVQPMIRLFERARDLYRTNPYLFAAGALVVTIAVLAFAVFPYIGAPSVLGFELGTYAYNLLNPVLHKLATYFVLNATQSAIFKSVVAFVATLGVVDLITRGFKEVAGWMNVTRAKDLGNASAERLKQTKETIPKPKTGQNQGAQNELITKLNTCFENLDTHAKTALTEITLSGGRNTALTLIANAENNAFINGEQADALRAAVDLRHDRLLLQMQGITPKTVAPAFEIKQATPIASPLKSAAATAPTSPSAAVMVAIFKEDPYKPVVYAYKLDSKTKGETSSPEKLKVHSYTIASP